MIPRNASRHDEQSRNEKRDEAKHHAACAAADDAYYAAIDDELERAAIAFNERAEKESR